jgi:hypothetical protein
MVQTTIARIISPTEVVLAAGSDQGVSPGMEFIIYDLSDRILDPETGADLGQIELVKGRVISVHVQDRMTTARTKTKRTERSFGSRAMIAAFEGTVTEVVPEQLKVDVTSPIPRDNTVRVGDRVRSVDVIAPLAKQVSA